MKGWLISVVAMALLFVIAEIIINEGELKKYIVGVLRVVFVITIFGSFISLIFNISNIKVSFDGSDELPIASSTTVDYFANKRTERAEKLIREDLSAMGIENVGVHINTYYDGAKTVIANVVIDFNETVISEEMQNIIAIEDIKKTVKRHVEVDEGFISVYGWH